MAMAPVRLRDFFEVGAALARALPLRLRAVDFLPTKISHVNVARTTNPICHNTHQANF
eukprot:SAG31_NODE_5258_length_2647_cov_1.622841_3_plen_58_part_00